jgi:SAM-dependent methyltransferase
MLDSLARWFKLSVFRGSARYWERRYQRGRNSGTGSYGANAAFKAQTLNQLLATHPISSVLELGCGDGAQLALIDYPNYVGTDISAAAVALCRKAFAGDAAKRFFPISERAAWAQAAGYDLALSLDVIYHLVEDSVFEAYMKDLFALARHHVVIYSTNFDSTAQTTKAVHVRHREFQRWVTREAHDWELAATIANPAPDLPDFFFYRRRA